MKSVKDAKKRVKHDDASLVKFIHRMVMACSMERYLGFNLPPGKHTTLHYSAENSYVFRKNFLKEVQENEGEGRRIKRALAEEYRLRGLPARLRRQLCQINYHSLTLKMQQPVAV
ncbi:MAG: hypothetical protein PHE24_01705 [Patescibacteria group bacterium]|nr:hypothetical protein [Patescibacteria group bacterium]